MRFQNLKHLFRSFEVFPLGSLVLDLGIIGFNLPLIGLWSRGLLHGKARNHCVERVSGRVTISLELISSIDVEPFFLPSILDGIWMTKQWDILWTHPNSTDPTLPWRHCLRLPLLRRYLRACENLVAESLPELRLGETGLIVPGL